MQGLQSAAPVTPEAGQVNEAQETKKLKIHQALLQAFMFSRWFVGDTFLWNCLEVGQ